jgi:hypothetical protein
MVLTEALDRAVMEYLNKEGSDNAGILAAVFRLNVEIGRLLRPTGDVALREFQLKVNEVTKAAKLNDRWKLAEAMELVKKAQKLA